MCLLKTFPMLASFTVFFFKNKLLLLEAFRVTEKHPSVPLPPIQTEIRKPELTLSSNLWLCSHFLTPEINNNPTQFVQQNHGMI